MPLDAPALRALAKQLRKTGIPAGVSRKDPSILSLPTLGGEGVAALRMLHPVLQTVRIQTGLRPKLPKKK